MNTYRHHIRFTAEKIASRLREVGACIYHERIPLDNLQIGPGDDPHQTSNWSPIKPGDQWGGRNEWRWFKADAAIPQSWAGRRVGLFFTLGHPTWRAQPEALAYVNGELRQGIDGNHHEILLTESASGGESYHVMLRAWCTMADEDVTALYQQIFWAGDLVQIDVPTRHFYHSVEVALGALRALNADRSEYHLILNGLDAAFLTLDLRSPGSPEFYDSVDQAQAALDAHLSKADSLPATVLATGHAHIDVLWRWRLINTREKTMHTFGNMVRLLEQYPDFHFTQSQPQLYQFAKEDAPELYEQIKALVKAGRWEPTGGMWVEVDCNIPSGESLVRQILLGKAFFRDEFGTQTPVLWLPDTFGYSWALPQLMKRSGLKYFMTSKISWSQYNRFPYDSFWWRGIDGTEVLTHFLTAPGDPPKYGPTYNAMLTAPEIAATWDHYQQKDQHDEVLTTFGYGDGGGGPTLEMLERAQRMKNHPGLPHVAQGSSGEFFERLEANAEGLPTWNGELYLEYHRGTYTTQARNKRANRKAEVLYHRAELAAAIATLVGQPYPRERLNEGWRLILLNQFHDVIPGSSIGEVYVDSLKEYEQVMAIGESVLCDAIDAIAKELPLAEGETATLHLHAAGIGATGTDFANGPGWMVERTSTQNAASAYEATPNHLENDLLSVDLNELGEITQIYDKVANRRVIMPPANQLQAFEDRPMRWDAWDIDLFYQDKMWTAVPQSVEVVETTQDQTTIEVHKQIGSSPVVQRITLHANSRRIDFHTVIDWRERHILLKVAFPVQILSPRATFDIQFGNVERPTHHNTSWDWARFESVGHKWADLSEANYGVSLLNDCKYGYDIKDNVLRLSLLRSPTFPDPEADQGEQEFTYSLLPHIGSDLRETIAEAYALNDPPTMFTVQGQGSNAAKFALTQKLFEVTTPDNMAVIVETVKGAEDGRGLIVRLYETIRSRGDATLTCGFPIAQAWETNLIEEDEQPLEITNGNEITLHFTPFQIRTLRLIPA